MAAQDRLAWFLFFCRRIRLQGEVFFPPCFFIRKRAGSWASWLHSRMSLCAHTIRGGWRAPPRRLPGERSELS